MINLILGIVIGAAFSPFWLSMWKKAKAYYDTVKTE